MSKKNSTDESSKQLQNYSISSTPCMTLIGWQSMQPAYITQAHSHPNYLSVNYDLILSPEDDHSLCL